MGKTNSNNDSPKGDKQEPRCDQEQRAMLIRCSKKKDMTEWNEWRNENPKAQIWLEEAHLGHANLAFANLRRACLFKANLQKADLHEADLRQANLLGANLESANIERAKIQGADLRGTSLNHAYTRRIVFDSSTLCCSIMGKEFYGSPVFKRFVEDCDYLEDFKRRHPAIYWIWFVLSDCGRSIALWAAWSLLFAVLFAHKFFALGPEAIDVEKLPWLFETVLYYSVVTFTTLGFGDIVPTTNAAAWWVMAEVITGYVMLGGLISIFANKLARRS